MILHQRSAYLTTINSDRAGLNLNSSRRASTPHLPIATISPFGESPNRSKDVKVELTFNALVIVTAPSFRMQLIERLIDIKTELTFNALAVAVAPSKPMVLLERPIEVKLYIILVSTRLVSGKTTINFHSHTSLWHSSYSCVLL